MRRFRWLSDGEIPPAHDLRLCGWTLLAPGEGEPASCPAIADDVMTASDIHGISSRAATMLIGVERSRDRAYWLALGFGEVLPRRTALAELELRAQRLAQMLVAVPRRRQHGTLELDLLLRDGMIDGRRLGLHPREFGLLWRLAQAQGQAVSPNELLAEVWKMNFRPETNSLAVHVCRLRAKLASAGLAGIISTTPDGGYALIQPAEPQPGAFPPAPATPPAIPLAQRSRMIDPRD